jgi:hypothetical protein
LVFVATQQQSVSKQQGCVVYKVVVVVLLKSVATNVGNHSNPRERDEIIYRVVIARAYIITTARN